LEHGIHLLEHGIHLLYLGQYLIHLLECDRVQFLLDGARCMLRASSSPPGARCAARAVRGGAHAVTPGPICAWWP
jgi:hypothetical protein